MYKKINLLCIILLTYSILFGKEISKNNEYTIKFGFIENKGQVENQEGRINQEVLYLFQGNNLHVQLRKNGFSYELIQTQNMGSTVATGQLEDNELPETNYKMHRVDIDFKGGNSNIEIQELEKGSGEIQYRAKESAGSYLTCKSFTKILYKNVYPQTDIEFLISEENGRQSFKYNIILHPGAEASSVQFSIFGSNRTQLTDKGNLAFETSCGRMEEQIPMSYELQKNGAKGKAIEAKFIQLDANTIGFGLNQDNKKTTRVIDPILWCTYFGGTGNEVGRNMDIDGSGNVYLAGVTTSGANIATSGAYQTIYVGLAYDGFLAKFSNNGALLWATYFGGAEMDNVYALEVTANGDVYLGGQTNSTSGIATVGAHQTTKAEVADGFLTKFNSNGNLIWSTYYGGSLSDAIFSIVVDGNGMVDVLGSSNSSTTYSYSGIHQGVNAGQSDALILRFFDNGTLKIATYYGGSLVEQVVSMTVDKNNHIYILGNSNSSTGIATSGAFQGALLGNSDCFIAKFDTNLVLLYGTYFGGSSWDYPNEVRIDSKGNIDIVGYTYSADFPLLNAYQPAFSTVANKVFVVQLDSFGGLNFSTFFGGGIGNLAYGMALDNLDNIYFCGTTNSDSGYTTSGAYQPQLYNTTYDAFITCFDKMGVLKWSTYFGGEGADYGRELAIDNANNLFFLGDSYSDTGISIGSVYQSVTGGNDEVFLLKMELGLPSNPLGNNTIGTDQTLCGSSIAADLIGSTPTGGTGSYSYTWLQSPTDLGGSYVGASGTNINKDYSPGSIVAETYYKRVVTDGSAFDTSNAVVIKIGSTFKAGFTVNKTIQCLRSNQFIFTDTTSATGLTYDWDFGNGATSTNQSETISYAYQAANVYKVRLITSFGGSCADTNYKTVYTVSDPIAKTITGLDQVGRLDTASYFVPHTAGSRYSWVFELGELKGNGTGNQIQIKWTAVGTTQLKVVETSSGNCLGDTAYLDVTISPALDIEELTNENAFQVYPNPNKGSFLIGGLNQKEFTVNVYDARGALVKTQVIQGETQIELDYARAGLYVIQLIDSNGMVYQKKMQINPE